MIFDLQINEEGNARSLEDPPANGSRCVEDIEIRRRLFWAAYGK